MFYKAQLYPRKELIIVCDQKTVDLENLIEEQNFHGDIKSVYPDQQYTLGKLRNIAIENSNGDIICQWDDDDLYDSRRLDSGVSALMETGSAAVFLRKWLVWCPEQRIITISEDRVWEGSMLAWRNIIPEYPEIARGEDSVVVDAIARNQRICLIDCASLYCYVIHGQNTWNESHMNYIIDRSSRKFTGLEYESMLKLMTQTLYVKRYSNLLN